MADQDPKITNERITLDINEEQRALIQCAADLQSRGNISAFILASALDRAAAVLRSYEETQLRAEERDRFYSFLANPPPPAEALISLFAEDNVGQNFNIVVVPNEDKHLDALPGSSWGLRPDAQYT